MRTVLALTLLAATATAAPKGKPEAAPAAPPALKLAISAPKGMEAAKAQAALIDAAVEEAIGKPVEVQVFADGPKVVQALKDGVVDAAWLSPVALLQARADTGIVPLATFVRNGSTEQRAVFIAKDPALKQLSDAGGKKVAWLGETSTSSTFARALLAQERAKKEGFFLQQSVVPSHKAACKAVLEGRADLAVTYAFTLAAGFDADLPSPDAPAPKDGAATPTLRIGGCDGVKGAEELHVVAETPSFPNDVIAARLKFAPADRKALTEALLTLGDREGGRKALLEAFDAEALKAADPAALEAVSKIFQASNPQ